MDREFSSGGVVFKETKTGNEKSKVYWLVTKSAPSRDFAKSSWRLPKGWIDDKEDGESPGLMTTGAKRAPEKDLRNAALKEVAEEGGVKAKIIKKIGTTKYFFTIKNRKILKFVTFYLMEHVKDLPEGFGDETEEVKWLEYESAKKKLSFSGEKKILDQARKLQSEGIQESLI